MLKLTRILLGTGCAIAIVAASLADASTAAARSDGSVAAPANVVRMVTHVPARVLDQVGPGIPNPAGFSITRLHRSLTSQGKPAVLTVNLAWCPHCAANSWALAIALSRFGTLSGLRVIDTGTLFSTKFPLSPPYSHTHGLSFLTARLRSRYISFRAVVLQDRQGRPLESLSPRQQSAIASFDKAGFFPAIDTGGAFGFVTSGYSPGVLQGRTWLQIARQLANPSRPVARDVDGLANVFTAAICRATSQKPHNVCASRGVRTASASRLP